MRIALGTLGSALVLFVAAAAGILGAWAMVTGAVMALVAGVMGAIALEERDLRRDQRIIKPL